MRIHQTKSRSRKSNDNALVECKNGAVVRKYFGHFHISQKHAKRINEFYKTYLNPFLNMHRFCAFSCEYVDPKGKIRKTYHSKDYMTPYQKLLSLENVGEYLKPGISVDVIRKKLLEHTHFDFAKEVEQARMKLLSKINN